MRLVFLDIGFTAPHDAYLADAAFTQGFTSPLRAGWTRIDNLDAINRDGRAFQRLLEFLNGTFVVPVPLDVLALEDLERPDDLFVASGLPPSCRAARWQNGTESRAR